MRKIPTLSFLEPEVSKGEELNYYMERGPICGDCTIVIEEDMDIDDFLSIYRLPALEEWETVWLGDGWISEIYILKSFYLIILRDNSIILEREGI